MPENHASAPPQTQTRQPSLPDAIPAQEAAAFDPALTTMSGLLSLQRTIGNRAVQRMLGAGTAAPVKQSTANAGLIQRGPDDPATQPQIDAALLHVLTLKVKGYVIKAFNDWKAAKLAEYNLLPNEWNFPAKSDALARQCFLGNLSNLLQPECTRVYNALSADQFFQFNMLERDVHPIASITKDTIKYLFDLLYSEPLYLTTMPQIVTQCVAELDAYLAKATIVRNISANVKQAFLTAHTRLDTSIANHNAAVVAAQTMNLATLTTDLTDKHQDAQDVLAQNTDVIANQYVANYITNNRDNPQGTITQAIIHHINGMETACNNARNAYRKSASRMSPENIAAINQAANNVPRRQQLLTLLNIYGIALFDAFVGMETDVQHLILKNCAMQGMTAAMQVQCAPGATASALSKLLARVGVRADTGPEIFSLMQGLHMQAESITVPGVTVDSWKLVGNFLVPASFSTGTLETDAVCLKHVKEENGVNPSKAKLEAYYVELAQACALARDAWTAAHRPAQLASSFQLAVGHWNIIVKSQNGEAQVFHVDSHYAQSA